MQDFHDLVRLCKGHTTYIQTHNFPDPDAFASAYGLQELLREFGIHAKICYEGRVDKLSTQKMLHALEIEIYSYDEIRSVLSEDDYIICVDSQKNSGNITDFIGEEVACIDHHPTFVPIEYKYKDLRATGACATILADYYQQLGIVPSSHAATALIYGIKMDTLQFSRGVTRKDIEMYAFLFDYADKDLISDLERNNMEFNDLKAYGTAIENIKIYGFTGFSYIPYDCPDSMIAMISDFILSLVEVEVAVIYSRRPDGLKFSVRSERSDVPAGTFVHKALEGLGTGGGHATMAGGHIQTNDLPKLGNFPDDFLRERFLAALEQ